MLRTLTISLFAAAAAAQTLTVDYPDSTIGAAAGQYPVYTGTGTSVIRAQLFCPSTFAGLPTVPMVCTRVGVQLCQPTTPVTWAQFVVRVGTTQVPALTNTWATNLPDQVVQVDLSNTTPANLTPTNQWVDWPLAQPFFFAPGDSVVLDVVSQASVAGQYLRTAIGTGVPRLVSTSYTGQATGGTPLTSGGIKFRMVFEPAGVGRTGPGCPGDGGFEPIVGGIGVPSIGNLAFAVTLDRALGGTVCALAMGFPAYQPLGGGCDVRTDASFLMFLGTIGVGAGAGQASLPFPIPAFQGFAGIMFDTQWGVFDPASPSPLGVVTSSSAKLLIN